MSIQRFEDILAWQQARVLLHDVHVAVCSSSARRDFIYRDQLFGAALSAMTNVAEGFGRRSNVEFIRFLDIARASLREVQSLLYVGQDLKYLNDDQFGSMYRLAGNTASVITNLIASMSK